MKTADREKMIFLGALISKLDEIIEDKSKAFSNAQKELKTARTMTKKAMQIAFKNGDATDLKTIQNHLKMYEVALVMPLGCKNDYEHLRPVETKVLAELLENVITDCQLCCDKEGKAAQQCEQRKRLIMCGLIGEGDEEHDCQFKKGVKL